MGWSRRTSWKSTWEILLVLLEDRRVRGLLAYEDDVEDRVQPAAAGEDATKLPFRHADRV
jgi:hypothetical protein